MAFCYRMGGELLFYQAGNLPRLGAILLATICKYWFELAELPFVD